MADVSVEAYIDTLALMHEAPEAVLPMSISEMHLFSYLACLVCLFHGGSVSNWGYRYTLTREGFPFSRELDNERNRCIDSSYISLDDRGRMRPCRPSLNDEVEVLRSIAPWDERVLWARASTASALPLPIGAIRHAVNNSPGVRLAVRLNQKRSLLDDDDIGLLYDEHRAIREVLEIKEDDLISPAVLWLSARVFQHEGSEIAD